jgi:hypothetical protein
MTFSFSEDDQISVVDVQTIAQSDAFRRRTGFALKHVNHRSDHESAAETLRLGFLS